jgi:hypothetical protein
MFAVSCSATALQPTFQSMKPLSLSPAIVSFALLITACRVESTDDDDEAGDEDSTGDGDGDTTETDTTTTTGTDTESESTDTTESETETTETESETETTDTDTTETETTETETTETGGDPFPALVGYWSFNGDTADHSGVNIDLTAVGDPEYLGSLSAGLGSAISLDGNDGAIGTDFVKFSGDDATIVAWVYADALDGSWNSIIKNWGDSATGQFHFGVGPDQADTLRNDTTMGDVTNLDPMPIGQWVHAAVVFDSVAAEYILYVDGDALVVNDYVPLEAGTATGLGIGVKPNDDGTNVAQQAEVGYWIGRIDEVGMYDAALTFEQINMLYQDGMAGIQLDGTSEE